MLGTLSFAVTVPRGTARTIDSEASHDRALSEAAPGRVLLIDDDPSVVEPTVLLLETEGHEVAVASTPEEAVIVASAKGT